MACAAIIDSELEFAFHQAHSTLRDASQELLYKLIHYDRVCATAFIAVDERRRKMLAVVRLHDDTSGETGECAILARSRLKEHGVGWPSMKHRISKRNQPCAYSDADAPEVVRAGHLTIFLTRTRGPLVDAPCADSMGRGAWHAKHWLPLL
jgi:hypothetical protein